MCIYIYTYICIILLYVIYHTLHIHICDTIYILYCISHIMCNRLHIIYYTTYIYIYVYSTMHDISYIIYNKLHSMYYILHNIDYRLHNVLYYISYIIYYMCSLSLSIYIYIYIIYLQTTSLWLYQMPRASVVKVHDSVLFLVVFVCVLGVSLDKVGSHSQPSTHEGGGNQGIY